MKTLDSLKAIERRAYRSTFEDGIYDIFFGAAFMILASIPAFKYAGIPAVFGYLAGVLLILIVVLGKRQITIPRLGMVEFGPERKSRKFWLLLACLAFLFLTSPLLFMMPGDGFGGGMAERVGLPLMLGFVAGPILVIIAYFLDYPRLYIYTAILFVGIPHSSLLFDYIGRPLNSILSFGLPGVLILGYGLTLLSRFMAKYPKVAQELNHAGQ